MARIARFDCFEVDLASGQLRKRGLRIHLRHQPFQVLAALLERPGELVTREELRTSLWPDGMFVDFENGLNMAVARLRAALGDAAERPRFIETVPRRGYRFLGRLLPPAPQAGASPSRRPRLLVLPFVNSSGDPAQEYFSDAMTDEVITALACVAAQRLAVIARATSMRYKGSQKDVARIGREVQVDYVVEGTIRQAGERVVANVQLVETAGQTHLFARKFEARPEEIFQLEDQIARAVATHIPAVGPGGGAAARKPTESVAAYTEYIQGRYEMWKWTPEGIAQARRHFEAALACDPRFALACDGLANLYGYLGMWGFLPPEEAEPLRWFYGVRAVELDPLLPEPLTHVAYHPQKTRHEDPYTYNWVEAEREMAHARDLAPDSPVIRVRHSTVLLMLERMEEAYAELERALEIDPLSPEVHFWFALGLFFGRRHDRALAVARRLVDLEPGPFACMTLGLACMGAGRFEESLRALRRAAGLSSDFPLVLGWLGLALGLAGREADARAVLERLRGIARERFVLPTSFAWLHVGLGEIDEAFAWMEQAANHNDQWIHPLHIYSFLDPLRGDPRLHALAVKLSVA
jgi:TolB-like protein/Flp pilus assembly protein TadD